MKRYVLKTATKQGEYLKEEYRDSKSSEWNHYIHYDREKVLEFALKNGLKDFWIEKILV